MMKSNFSRTLLATLLVTTLSVTPFSTVQGCTRALYTADDGMVITGRSMDWKEDMHSNLWVMPRSIARDGAAGPLSIKWVAKYGSIVASGYDVATTDGMNEKGMVANLLFLAESDYGKRDPNQPALSISLWAQYVLDNFATVDETVTALGKNAFQVVTADLPTQAGRSANLHLSISDSTGDSAIFQYIDGKLTIHHGKQYKVMTNSPTYDQQLALNKYWQEIGGLVFLPGTNRSADRFARTSFLLDAIPKITHPAYISAIPNKSFANQAVASVMSVMRSVSVPLGITTPNQPNISSTIWRIAADQTNKVYFFDSATMPNAFWVPLADLNFSPDAPVMKLTLAGGQVYSGNVAQQFVATAPFKFEPVH